MLEYENETERIQRDIVEEIKDEFEKHDLNSKNITEDDIKFKKNLKRSPSKLDNSILMHYK